MSSGTGRKQDPSAVARQHLKQAYRHDAREELEAALAECEAALQLAGDWGEAHNLHGIILEGLGRPTEALAAYTEALRLEPALGEAKENLAELEAELAEGRVPPGLSDGLLARESAPVGAHAPACEVCGRQDETVREVLYPYVFSALIVTFRRAFAGRWCRRHRDLRLGLAGLITVTLGWLGIPWGLFYTPLTLLKLARGGARLQGSNMEVLTGLAGHKLRAGKPKEAAACLEECLKYEEQPQILASLRDLYQTHGIPRKAPRAALAGSFLRVLLLAALLGGSIGLVDFAITLGFSALAEAGSFFLTIFSWIPFVTMLYLGGLVLARLVEGGLARCQCRHGGLSSALGALAAMLAIYGVLQGSALLEWVSSGPSGSLGDLLLTAGAVLTSGGALTVAWTLSRAGIVDLIYLFLLLVAAIYYIAIGVFAAQSTARWQQRLAAAREEFHYAPTRVPSLAPGWAAIAGTVAVVVLLAVLFPHGRLAAEQRALVLVEEGLTLFETGNVHGATLKLEEATRLQPDLPEAHYYLAWSYAAGDDPGSAIAELEEAIRLDPGDARFHADLGVVYRMVGAPKKSIDSYQAAIQLDPAFAEAHCGLGITYLAQQNLEAAEGAFQAALDLDPDLADAYLGIGMVKSAQGDHDQAAESFSALLRLEPENALALTGLGWVEYYGGREKDACLHFREAVRLDPWLADAHNGVGWCHLTEGVPEDAIESFETALELDPGLAHAYTGLGWVYYDLKRFDEAVAAFETAIDLTPGSMEARAGLAMAHSAQGEE